MQFKVTFVDNLLHEDKGGWFEYNLQPHLGLISLIACVENSGIAKVSLVDPKLEIVSNRCSVSGCLYSDLAKEIASTRPDVVAFTSLGCNFICTLKTARHFRELCPQALVILGGPHATILDKQILSEFTEFDVIARREAEFTIVELLSALRNKASLSAIPGITYREQGRVIQNAGNPVIENLDELPFAAYHHHPIRDLDLTTLRVDAGRGCPFHCTFCSTATFFGRQYRLKSARRLLYELDTLSQTYGVRDFALTHDLFTVNKKKVEEFCHEVRSRGYTWKCSARMDCVDEKLLRKMADAGCREIYYGIEAGSERMQQITEKKLDLRLFEPTLNATQEFGINATVSFITGYPDENQSDQEATLDLISNCFERQASPAVKANLNVQLHMLTPEPGTAITNLHADRLNYDGFVSDFNFPSLEDDDSAIMQAHRAIFVNHHYFTTNLPRSRNTRITSVYPILFTLGFPVSWAIISSIGGRLSSFCNSFLEFCEIRNVDLVDESVLLAFVKSKLHPDHPLVSLIRYMMACNYLSGRAFQSRREVRSENTFYCWNACENHRVCLLRKIHLVPEMFDDAGQLQIRDEPSNSYPHNLVLLHSDLENSQVRNLEIGAEAADFILPAFEPNASNSDRYRLVAFLVKCGIPAEPKIVETHSERNLLQQPSRRFLVKKAVRDC